jgi:hypothetical protein
MSKTPKPGAVLQGDPGVAVVMADDWTPWDALRSLVLATAGYDLPDSARDTPAADDLLADLKVLRWRSCTKAYREANGVDEDWWAEDGDGARSIRVGWYETDDLYDLAVVAPLLALLDETGEAGT